ncbi:cleavage/polyadenylation specificity factor, 25kDa subunit [Tanacetum coccineum]
MVETAKDGREGRRCGVVVSVYDDWEACSVKRNHNGGKCKPNGCGMHLDDNNNPPRTSEGCGDLLDFDLKEVVKDVRAQMGLSDTQMILGRIEPLLSDGNLRLCFPRRGGLGGSSETRRDNRVAAFRRIRVGSWNVGSLTGKLLELVDAFERHKVDIPCFQETKWKGSSNKEGNRYKLWYSGSPTTKNAVGVILKACLNDKVVYINRWSDRIISLTIVIDGETINVISAYAPQLGLSEVEKKTFWDFLDKVVREFLTDQRLILRSDLNGHIGATTEGYAGVHRGFGYGNTLASIIKDAVKDTLGVAIRISKTHTARRESWWLCEEVQSIVVVKQARFRELLSCREDEEGRTITDEEEIKKRWGGISSLSFSSGGPVGLKEACCALADCYIPNATTRGSARKK